MMDPLATVAHGGYILVAVGTFFEGEMIMLAAGVAASAGLLNLPLTIAAGMAGVFGSDSLCFFIGRLAARPLERWFPKLHARLGTAFRLIERYQEGLIVFFQFFPGLCTITPMAFGMTRISTVRFMALDFIGNALWTCAFGFGGFALGQAAIRICGAVHPWLVAVTWALGLVGAGTLIWLARRKAALLASAG